MAGYIGSKAAVTQADGYTKTEADSRYANVSGDTFDGGGSDPAQLTVKQNGNASGFIIKNYDGNEAQLVNVDNGPMVFKTNDDEKMRIDSSGRVGIGVVPSTIGTVSASLQLNQSFLINYSDNTTSLSHNAYYDGSNNVASTAGASSQYYQNSGMHIWRTAPSVSAGATVTYTERMRIDSSGNLLVGKTASNLATVGHELLDYGRSIHTVNASTVQIINRLSNDGDLTIFQKNSSTVGSVSVSGSSTSYSTSSDYRLKEGWKPITNASDRLMQLKPCNFAWKSDGSRVDGFLAHEAQTIVPEAVTGTHNEVEVWSEGEELPDGVSVGDNKLNDKGETIPVMQGIDQAKLVPLLTAALQEAITKIETLETKVAALEAGE